uniref:Uncharacterized protein n=1 Tax=Glossina brevipalpis TaxID=37001 RepID=A0A1A9WLW9_9MUSC
MDINPSILGKSVTINYTFSRNAGAFTLRDFEVSYGIIDLDALVNLIAFVFYFGRFAAALWNHRSRHSAFSLKLFKAFSSNFGIKNQQVQVVVLTLLSYQHSIMFLIIKNAH